MLLIFNVILQFQIFEQKNASAPTLTPSLQAGLKAIMGIANGIAEKQVAALFSFRSASIQVLL